MDSFKLLLGKSPFSTYQITFRLHLTQHYCILYQCRGNYKVHVSSGQHITRVWPINHHANVNKIQGSYLKEPRNISSPSYIMSWSLCLQYKMVRISTYKKAISHSGNMNKNAPYLVKTHEMHPRQAIISLSICSCSCSCSYSYSCLNHQCTPNSV